MYQVSDQTGRRFVITGANSGTGKEAVRRIAAAGGHVVMGVRSEDELFPIEPTCRDDSRYATGLTPARLVAAAARTARMLWSHDTPELVTELSHSRVSSGASWPCQR
jgi:NAD(P)-dependent dehydrogenase (short-subunit alcohol dehydrogenase family)